MKWNKNKMKRKAGYVVYLQDWRHLPNQCPEIDTWRFPEEQTQKKEKETRDKRQRRSMDPQ